MNLMRPTLRDIIIKMSKVKERILKVSRDKQLVTYKGAPIRLSSNFQQKLYRLEGTGTKYSKCWKGKNNNNNKKQTNQNSLTTKNTLPSKVIIHNWRRDRLALKEMLRERIDVVTNRIFHCINMDYLSFYSCLL